MAGSDASIINGDRHYTGNVSFTSTKNVSLPANTIINTTVSTSAAIAATKLVHRRHVTYWEESSTAASTTAYPVFSCYGATGTVIALEAGSVVAPTVGATLTVDLLKNGSSIVSSVITLDATNTARVPESVSGFSATSVADGDLLELSMTATTPSGVQALGLFVTLIIDEDPV